MSKIIKIRKSSRTKRERVRKSDKTSYVLEWLADGKIIVLPQYGEIRVYSNISGQSCLTYDWETFLIRFRNADIQFVEEFLHY